MNQPRIEYHDFELDIRPDSVRLLESTAGDSTQAGKVQVRDVAFTAGFDSARLEELVERTRDEAAGRSGATIRLDDFASEVLDEARSLGQNLFGSLFPEGTALIKKYIGSYYQAAGRGVARLRLRLRISSELSHIPWEILAPTADLPGEGDFLALELSIARRPATRRGPAAPFEQPLPLKLLLVADDPFLEEQERLEAQKALIRAALEEEPLAGRIQISELVLKPGENSTLEALERTLEKQEFHIVHFMGHGYYDLDQEPPRAYLSMTRDGQPHDEEASEIAKAFRPGIGSDRGLRLVVFNACEGARARPGPNYDGLAQALLDSGVPAVVGMQYLISDPAAQHFASAFYGRLAETMSADESVRAAREEINRHITGTLEWLTPVLFFTGRQRLFLQPAEDPVLARDTYLRLLDRTTQVIPDDDYLPVLVTRSTSVVHGAQTDSALAQAEIYVHAATNTHSPTADARDVLIDPKTGRPTRPINILLGEAGSGKSTVVSQIIGRLLPEMGSEERPSDRRGGTWLPIRLSANTVDWSSAGDPLPVLVYQALSQVWSHPAAAEILAGEEISDGSLARLPSLDSVRRWINRGAWRLLVIVEDLEDVEPQERRRFGAALHRLMQSASRQTFLITGNVNAFAEYAPYLGQNPQWQIAPLTEDTVRVELAKKGLEVDRHELLAMLRQPWALFTYIKMRGRGEAVPSQATLLRGRIDQLLDEMPLLLRPRILQTLMQLALSVDQRCQEETESIPQAPVSDLFEIMTEVRGGRSYSLESLYRNLVEEGVLQADPSEETVRFSSAHVQAILSALAIDQDLRHSDSTVLSNWDMADSRLRMTLILFSQLGLTNQRLVVKAILARLGDGDLDEDWEKRLELLDLAVHCFHLRGEQPDRLRDEIIRELIRTLLDPEDESRLADIHSSGYLKGAEYNVCRLKATTMRIRAVRLLGYLRDRHIFEPLRWLIVERVRYTESCGGARLRKPHFARSGVRRAAGLAMFQMWEDRTLGLKELLRADDDDMKQLAEIMEAWEAYQGGESKLMGEAFGKLVAWLNESHESWLSSIAAVAIAEIGGQYRDHPLRKPAVEKLTEAFAETPGDTRWAIGDGAGSLSFLLPEDTKPLLDKLIEVATKRHGEKQFAHRASQRETAVYALGKLRRPEALAQLRGVVLDRSQPPAVTARAARAVGECSVDYPDHAQVPGVRRDLMAVVSSFQSDDPWDVRTRLAAIGSLGYIGHGRTTSTLVEVIRHDASDPGLAARAVLALLQIVGREEAARRLQKALPSPRSRSADKSHFFRLLAALAEIDPPAAAKAISGEYREWTVKALEFEFLDKELAGFLIAWLAPADHPLRPSVRKFLHLLAWRRK